MATRKGRSPSRKSDLDSPPPPAKKFKEPLNKYAAARAQLHLSAQPKRLICREKEYKLLQTFIVNAIQGGEGSTLYLSGVPGTGKTATVTRVIHDLQAEHTFRFIELNGMQMRVPEQAYITLWKQLGKEKASAQRAAEALDMFFSQKQKQPTIVLVDELDLLATKNEKVLYNLFEWPTRRGSRLIVIGIANTMDLPERLSSRVSSRMGNRRLIFTAYTSTQLENIIKDRVEPLNLFAPDSIDVCTKRLAASSGDVRGAFAICSRATEIAERANAAQVSDDHVAEAVSELLSPVRMSLLKSLSLHERVMLAVLIRMQRTGSPPLLLDLLLPMQTSAAGVLNGVPPSAAAISMTLARLCVCQLVSTDNPNADLHQRVSLRISEAEVRVAYGDSPMVLDLML